MRKIILLPFTIMLSCFCLAQKIKSEELSYRYSRLPSQPINKSIRNYTVVFEAPYEAKNKQLLAEYDLARQKAEAKYNKEMADYPAAVKAAEARYEKELAEYNKKTAGEKFVEKNILGENSKPVKQLPPKPYLEQVPKPALKTSYDYQVLASTYFKLEGFENNATNAVQIIVTLYGFDYTEPRVLTAQKDMVSYKNGSSSTYKANYYHVNFSYRHPMAVKVVSPDGRDLLSLTPQPLNIYKIYKSAESQTMPSFNPELLIKTNEEKILQENLGYINALVNDKFGFGKVERKASIYFIKEKGNEYADLQNALNNASSGFNLLDKEPEAARGKLQLAIDTWTNALKESNPSDKKARIDNDVTVAICLNLLEAYFAMGDEVSAAKILAQMNSLNLSSGERKSRDDFELLFTDLKKRKLSNQ